MTEEKKPLGETIQETRVHYLTVGDLKKHIRDLPDDTPVCYQRIEDMYFENNGWTTNPILWERWEGRPDDMTEAITAWGCYVWDGVVFIHAHY